MIQRMMQLGLFVCLAGWLAAAPAAQPTSPSRTLTVAVKPAPPFALKNEQGEWTGITVELWDRIAEQLQYDYEWRELDVEAMLDELAAGRIDVAAAALTVTSEREERIDFSHPFYQTGLGIAVRARGGGWAYTLTRIFTKPFLSVMASLGLVLLIAGLVVWLFERRANPEQFGGRGLRGLGAGFWWSAVTMTTVGYGDKAPVTLGGRLAALIWMFTSVIIISGFTAAIASSLTVSQLGTAIEGPEDLASARVGTVPGTISERWLEERMIISQPYKTSEALMAALNRGEIEAAVYDAPILKYLAQQQPATEETRIMVLPQTFRPQSYALGLPPGSELREPVNQAMLDILATPEWERIKGRFLGN